MFLNACGIADKITKYTLLTSKLLSIIALALSLQGQCSIGYRTGFNLTSCAISQQVALGALIIPIKLSNTTMAGFYTIGLRCTGLFNVTSCQQKPSSTSLSQPASLLG